MKILAPIKNYQSFYFKAGIKPKNPSSGFSFAFGRSGNLGFTTGVVFSGKSGLVFDQNNNFFGGYRSGETIDIEGHFFGSRLSYFYNDILINNNIPVTSDFNSIEFDKYDDSELTLELNYVSGFFDESAALGLESGDNYTLLSSDLYYLLPSI